jgi:hypothetical protein
MVLVHDLARRPVSWIREDVDRPNGAAVAS